MSEQAKCCTPEANLHMRLMSASEPKSELEWYARNLIEASQAREAELRQKLEERTEEMLRIAGLNATNVGLLKAAEARIKEWQQGENEDLTASRRENAELTRKLAELQQELKDEQEAYADTNKALNHVTRENAELKQRVKVLTDGLQKIITDGDYTAPEGMKRTAQEILNQTPQQTAAQIERWHIEWMMKLPRMTGYFGGENVVAIPPLPKESNSPETDLDEALRRQ